jgi:bacterioferritin-associated ferredoxin
MLLTRECAPEFCETCTARVVCRCLQVTEEQVVETIKRLELETIQEVRQHLGAGDGCTCCHVELRELLARHQGVRCG